MCQVVREVPQFGGPVMRGLQLTPFGAGRVPSDAMIWWAAVITALALLFAIRVIKRRAL